MKFLKATIAGMSLAVAASGPAQAEIFPAEKIEQCWEAEKWEWLGERGYTLCFADFKVIMRNTIDGEGVSAYAIVSETREIISVTSGLEKALSSDQMELLRMAGDAEYGWILSPYENGAVRKEATDNSPASSVEYMFIRVSNDKHVPVSVRSLYADPDVKNLHIYKSTKDTVIMLEKVGRDINDFIAPDSINMHITNVGELLPEDYRALPMELLANKNNTIFIVAQHMKPAFCELKPCPTSFLGTKNISVFGVQRGADDTYTVTYRKDYFNNKDHNKEAGEYGWEFYNFSDSYKPNEVLIHLFLNTGVLGFSDDDKFSVNVEFPDI